jgi:hypothetical protein
MSDRGLDEVLSLKEFRERRFGCTSLGVGVEGNRVATLSAIECHYALAERMKHLTRLKSLKLKGVQ